MQQGMALDKNRGGSLPLRKYLAPPSPFALPAASKAKGACSSRDQEDAQIFCDSKPFWRATLSIVAAAAAQGRGRRQDTSARQASTAILVERHALCITVSEPPASVYFAYKARISASVASVQIRGGRRPAQSECRREQHGVAGDGFAGIEILRDQRWRHRQSVAGIGETFAGRAIHWKFFGRLERGNAC